MEYLITKLEKRRDRLLESYHELYNKDRAYAIVCEEKAELLNEIITELKKAIDNLEETSTYDGIELVEKNDLG